MTARLRGPSRRDLALLRDVEERLTRLSHEDITSALVPAWFAPTLRDLLHCDRTIAYRPECASNGEWSLGDMSTTDAAVFTAYDARLREAARTSFQPFQYQPLRPDETQRNRACSLRDIHTHGPDATCVIEEVWPQVGLGGHDQLRVLVCEGPVLLGWVGGFREEPFTRREQAALAALVVPLRRALALRRRLADAGLAGAGFASALEAIGAPSFVVSRNASIAHMNTAGSWLLERRRSDTLERLKNAIAGHEHASFVSRLEAPGTPECFLVVLRDSGTTLEARLVMAVRNWGASEREIEVLRRLVAGDSNKEIAVKLGCSEVSVERRVTKLLRKAKCDGRSRLIATFWTAV